ncbi:MAG: DUF4430 domain-containing protein [Clostridia bacterium]|nr:DUF4430 domain-containing protein [Clostridia bacterium]
MKKTNKILRILSVVISLVLIVAMALCMTACKETDGNNTPSSSDTVSVAPTEVGSGETKFAFRVTDKDGKSTDFVVATDKKTVGEALIETGLIEGEDSQYGLFVKKVNGIVADFDVDKTYWAFYVDGGYATEGVEKTDIEAGKTYEFRVSK